MILDIQILLLLCLVIVSAYGLIKGYKFEDLMDGMKTSIGRAQEALLIFLLIGAVIGSWIQAGTVPAIVYYGLSILDTAMFLPLGLLICSFVSIATGTSWGTAGTVGIALMGIGTSLGIPAPLVAGMVISGAFFGDKISPMSDTTNLAAASSGAKLYDHIRGMLVTTIPAYIISLVLYYLLGRQYVTGSVNEGQIRLIQDSLQQNFQINGWVLLPMLLMLILSIARVNAIITMVCGIALALLVAIVIQDVSIVEALNSLNRGYNHATGIELVDNLLVRGGIQRMMGTFSLSFIALCLGGVLEKIGILDIFIKGILSRVKSDRSLSLITLFTSFISTAAMGEIYLGIILNGQLYRETYEKRGIKKQMLSRLLEEGGTLMGPLIPWTTAGAFMANTLGVNVIEYIPYAFLNILNPLISIVLIIFGISIFRERKRK